MRAPTHDVRATSKLGRRGLAWLALAAGCSTPPPPPVFVPQVVVTTPPREGGPEVAPTAVGENATEPSGPPSEVELSLQGWSEKTQCDDFDYFPEGGIRSFWCHRPTRVTLALFRSAARVDIFASGPHPRDGLALDAANAFGHYNPDFVRWLVEKGSPSARGSVAQKATQASYDGYLRPLAEIFWKTLQKARADRACFASEQAAYSDQIARRKLPKAYYERWFWFMNPYFCSRGLKGGDRFYYDNAFDAGVDGNVTKTVIGFWLRRSIDGTMEPFADGLKKLITSYQPELLASASRFADPAALTRALDGAVKGAAACKDPRAPTASDTAEILVAPDGHVEGSLMLRGTASPVNNRHAPPSAQARCVEAAFAAQRVPAFDGKALHFSRVIALR